ncbi:MAG: haloacid dehalogenase type II [Dongiaceae bacterium]
MTPPARPSAEAVGAVVFDAYGTLFDVNAAAATLAPEIGPEAAALAELWRRKQLEYSWLRTLMGRHSDFWQVTADALDFAMEKLRLPIGVRPRLLELYFRLPPFADARPLLERCRRQGLKLAILSNGAPEMLNAAITHAGLTEFFDAVLSVEAVGLFKPRPEVYRLAVEHLGVPASRTVFVSANGWDVAGAAAFGFAAVWINRAGEPLERLPALPIAIVASLAELPQAVALD